MAVLREVVRELILWVLTVLTVLTVLWAAVLRWLVRGVRCIHWWTRQTIWGKPSTHLDAGEREVEWGEGEGRRPHPLVPHPLVPLLLVPLLPPPTAPHSLGGRSL